jgi:hypothetical protein
MTSQLLDEKKTESLESTHHAVSGIVKEVWQTPKVQDMDFSDTKNSGAENDDGGFAGS